MEEIVKSLREFTLTKEIQKILLTANPLLKNKHDILDVFKNLYQAEIIGADEFLAFETKFSLSHFCQLVERYDKNTSCGIYLYDENEKKLWNGATPNVPSDYNEYSHGLSAIHDIKDGEEIPIYTKGALAVGNIERGEDIVSLNHKEALLRNGFNAYMTSPLNYKGKVIGHSLLLYKEKKIFTQLEIERFAKLSGMIEENLVITKNQLLTIVKSQHQSD